MKAWASQIGLWFDVEVRYNTTTAFENRYAGGLWFDVEVRYNTTKRGDGPTHEELWFDVEVRYNTTLCKFS